MRACVLSCFSCVWLFATLWTVAGQSPLSMGFPRQKYWSRLLFPLPGDLPNPGIEPKFPALQAASSPSEPPDLPHLPRCKRERSFSYDQWGNKGFRICKNSIKVTQPGPAELELQSRRVYLTGDCQTLQPSHLPLLKAVLGFWAQKSLYSLFSYWLMGSPLFSARL